jgi:ankyrin repeat protein
MVYGRSFEVEPCSAKPSQSSGIKGHKVVKQLGFALFFAGALLPQPAFAQALNTSSYDFIDAVKKSDGNKAIELLGSNPRGLVDTKDGDGNTALIIAISRSDENWTGFLLNKGADPNLAGKGGDTPLIAAARVRFDEAARWLLGMGAKVDLNNKMGETPLIVAVQQRDAPLVKLLLEHGANPDKSDAAAGYSARDYATRDPRARDILKMIDESKPKAATAAAK